MSKEAPLCSSQIMRGVESFEDPTLGSPWSPSATLSGLSDQFPEIIGRSAAMRKVLIDISKIARSDSAVLINGESGTGKELVAKAIHRLSPRSNRRFVAINCSSIPENLLESELFGYEKGAFTGAVAKKQGYFEVASRGTIFLDEVGDTHPHLQAKLLRVLQEKQFTPVGSNEVKTADVRIVAATNVDLQKAVADKNFRLDLYYRLNVLPLILPPLRHRIEDLPDLIDHFLAIANNKQEIASFFADETLDFLKKYDWPGNVRELQNVIERLAIISGGGMVTPNFLPDEIRHEVLSSGPSLISPTEDQESSPQNKEAHERELPISKDILPVDGIDLTGYIENIENSFILQALARTGNNKNKAAKLLGLNRTTLVERIKKRKLARLNNPCREL